MNREFKISGVRRSSVLLTALILGASWTAFSQDAQYSGPAEPATTEWSLPTPNSRPVDALNNKRDGSVWYTAEGANLLGRLDPKTRKFEEFHLRPGSDPYAIVEHAGSGVQTTVYFTSRTGGFIGEFDTNTRDVREFRIEGGKMHLQEITFDPNGVVWFTMAKPEPGFPQGSKVGFLNLFSSEIEMVETPTKGASPRDIAVNSKGTPFFTEDGSPRLGSLDPVTLKVTEYKLPNVKSSTRELTITSDDAVWYTDYSRGYLGRFDPKEGKFDEWQCPGGADSRPSAIVSAGNIIWVAETGTAPKLVRFDISTKQFQSFPLKAGETVDHLYADPNGTVLYALPNSNQIVRFNAGGSGQK